MAEETQTQEKIEETPAETVEVPAAPVEPKAPVTEVIGQITPRQAVTFANDDIDKRFEAVRTAIESDDLLSPSEKQMKLLDLDLKREQRQETRQRDHDTSEDRIRNGYASQYKTTRSVVDSTWNEASAEANRRLGRFDHGAAMIIFEDKLAAKKPVVDPTPLAEKKNVGQTRTEPRGVRQAPAQPDKKLTVQEMLDRASMGDTSHIPADVLAEARR